MSMISDFFKDSGYGNYYQGSAKNTSGQWYDPANYGGLKAFDPNKPNDPGSIGPGTYGRASLGNWLGNFSAMPADGGAQRAVSPLTAPGNWQTGGAQPAITNAKPMPLPRPVSMGEWLKTGGAQRQAPGLGMVSAQGPRVQAGQGLASPQSGFAYTLADLLRNYYA